MSAAVACWGNPGAGGRRPGTAFRGVVGHGWRRQMDRFVRPSAAGMRRAILVISIMLVTGLAGGLSPVARAAAGADWRTFGDSLQRDGENTAETAISTAN